MVKKKVKMLTAILGAVTMLLGTYAPSVSAEHVHSWKNVTETVDVYEDQPIMEEVPIYEEQVVKEYHDIVGYSESGHEGFDMTAAYEEYIAAGGTQEMNEWSQTYLIYELGVIWYTYVRKPVLVKKQVQVGTEMKPTGETKKVKTGTQQKVYRVCTACEETASAIGDLSGDKVFDFLDLVKLAKLLMPDANPTSEQAEIADVNQNGKIDFLDLVMLSKELMPK